MIDARYIQEVVIDAHPFIDIKATIDAAIKLAGDLGYHEEWFSSPKGALVKFDFNGVMVSVRMDSNPWLIYRDFMRAAKGFTDGNVGPYPVEALTYAERRRDVVAELKVQRQRQRRLRRYNAKAKAHRKALEAKLAKAPQLEFADKSLWDEWIDSIENADYTPLSLSKGYMLEIVAYAERWGRLMQAGISKGKVLEDIADETAREADVNGITGHMENGAVMILSRAWKHGDELRIWHKNRWGAPEDASGVVNPAVLTPTS